MTALAWIVAGLGVVAVRVTRQARRGRRFLAELPPAEPAPERESERDTGMWAGLLADRRREAQWRAEGRRLIGRDQ
ncbi:MAG TPA: hypothetical protein VIS06_00420 [Mycobacteriales bacterium]